MKTQETMDVGMGDVCVWLREWGHQHPQHQQPLSFLFLGPNSHLFTANFPDAHVFVPAGELSLSEGEFLRSFKEKVEKTEAHFDAIVANNVIQEFKLQDAQFLTEFLRTTLHALKGDGILMIREDLGPLSANIAQYTNCFDCYRTSNGNSNELGFQFQCAKCLPTSVETNGNWLDTCWLLQKSEFQQNEKKMAESVSVRHFLDQQQYSDTGIGMYEMIFGHGFISPGGSEENAKFVELLNLKPGQKVLDVGCGIGGNAFYTAKKYDVFVTGADLSSNMLSVAVSRAQELRDNRVNFIITDATKYEFPENHFDAIYSRDCIIHIADKLGLFKKFHKWLKPGGRVVLTDYCVGEKEHTPAFQTYLNNRHYGLRPINTYIQALNGAGFHDVKGDDITSRFKEILEAEWAHAEQNKAQFIKDYSAEKYEGLVSGWRNKLGYIKDGDHKWAVFQANK